MNDYLKEVVKKSGGDSLVKDGSIIGIHVRRKDFQQYLASKCGGKIAKNDPKIALELHIRLSWQGNPQVLV